MLLEVKNIVKRYGNLTAVNRVNLSVKQGTCLGLLGANGAGKTTLIEIMEDIIDPSEGEILYKGKPRTGSFSQEAGIQFQETSLLLFIKVKETLDLFKSLYHKSMDVDELIKICHLTDIQNQFNETLSGGQRQRLLLALAMINKPEIIFLDEPSTGLDPQARHNLWDIIRSIKQQKKTIILTTHYMEEAQHLCDEIAIMDEGKIIAEGTPRELIKKYCGAATAVIPSNAFKKPIGSLSMKCREIKDSIEIQAEDMNVCLNELLSLGVDLGEMNVRTPDLEDVFLNLTGRKLRA